MRKSVRPVKAPSVAVRAVRPPSVNTGSGMYQAGKNAGELARQVVNTIMNVSKVQARRGMTRGR